MIDHDQIRGRLKDRLSNLGLPLTGKWLKEHGVGQTTIRNFLDGANQSITIETVAKLAKPLKTSEQWLIFGPRSGVSEQDLREMAETAAEEIQAGMRIEEIRNAVSSALREQLKLHLAVGAAPDSSDEPNAPGTGAQSPAPTKAGGRAKSHSA